MVGKESAPIQTVVVGNNREYFAPIDPHVPAALRDEFVQSDIDEADMDIMWLGDDKVVLLPNPVDEAFVDDVSGIFNYKNTQILTPEDKGLGLSRNVIKDPKTYNSVAETLRAAPAPKVVPWGHTDEYQELVDTLKADGVFFSTPETPSKNALWIPEYLDTKIGSRELLQRAKEKNPKIKVPEGFVTTDVDSAMKLADYFLGTDRGFVVKANLGGAGVGVHVFPPSQFDKNPRDNRAKIEVKIRQNPLMSTDPLVVEEYIAPDFSHHGVFPSVDSIIKPDGTVVVKIVDAMIIHHDEEAVGFYGCVLGKGLFTQNQNKELKDMSATIGGELSKLGYRGWFDVDYILSESGEFYVTEANLRRTSMSYMVELAELLFGEDYENKMAMRSNDKYIRPNLNGVSYKDLKQHLAPVLYPMNEQQRGVVITQSMRSMYGRGKFGYVSIGEDQADTRSIELQLDGILAKL